MKKALVTDFVHPVLIDGLNKRGYKVDYYKNITLEEVRETIENYDGIVINSKIKMDRTMIAKGKNLKWIGRLGSGLEIVDLSFAKSNGIVVLNTPEGNRNAVAEHAIGMLLMISNNLKKGDAEVRSKCWNREENRGWELKGKTLGIIGLGNTGSKLAQKLSSWELDIISYDKYRKDSTIELPFVRRVDLEDILKESDIISLHLPLTAETHHMVDTVFLQKCKKNVIVINTSRGKVINTKALLTALETKQIKGACLDVFENEKPNTFSHQESEMYESLYNMDNVILSPHVAGWTQESLKRIATVMLQKLDLRI